MGPLGSSEKWIAKPWLSHILRLALILFWFKAGNTPLAKYLNVQRYSSTYLQGFEVEDQDLVSSPGFWDAAVAKW